MSFLSLKHMMAIAWKDIGVAVSNVFGGGYGYSTMVGPIDVKPKQRKVINRRKRVRRSTELARSEELGEGSREERSDTDKNMLTMFNILRKSRVVKLENLVLNRNSFAQTVENLFALSFLVKDGRAEIKVDEARRICKKIYKPIQALIHLIRFLVLGVWDGKSGWMEWRLLGSPTFSRKLHYWLPCCI